MERNFKDFFKKLFQGNNISAKKVQEITDLKPASFYKKNKEGSWSYYDLLTIAEQNGKQLLVEFIDKDDSRPRLSYQEMMYFMDKDSSAITQLAQKLTELEKELQSLKNSK